MFHPVRLCRVLMDCKHQGCGPKAHTGHGLLLKHPRHLIDPALNYM